jgi:hypothetical protein
MREANGDCTSIAAEVQAMLETATSDDAARTLPRSASIRFVE